MAIVPWVACGLGLTFSPGSTRSHILLRRQRSVCRAMRLQISRRHLRATRLWSRTILIRTTSVYVISNQAYFSSLILLQQFFQSYTTLIMSGNYVTKRQSLKLLGEILLDRANFAVMTRYIASEANLKMMMNLLRDKSRNIQFEAFHVFKVRRHRNLFLSLSWMCMVPVCSGVCGESEEATTDRKYTPT